MALTDLLPGSFWANDPNVNQQLRQKIALSMMSGRKGYPKNVGEGLTAIGDALGDIGMARMLERSDAAARESGAADLERAQKAANPQTSATETAVPPVQVADNSQAVPQPAQPAEEPAQPTATGVGTVGPSAGEVQAAQAGNLPLPPRARVAATMAAVGGPQVNPTVAGASQVPVSPAIQTPTPVAGGPPDQRLALADTGTVSDIPLAPRVPPGVQLAQANPPARYDYVMPVPGRARAPAETPKSAEEQALELEIARKAGNPYAVQGLTRVLQDYQNKRALIDKQNAERYQNELLQERELEMKRQEQLQMRAKASTEGQQAEETLQQQRNVNTQRAHFGNMDPEQVYKEVAASRGLAQSAADAIKASSDARRSLDGGAIIGAGAGLRLDIAKLVTGMGFADKGNRIANTETFRAAMQPIVASILHQTSGTSQLSEGELKFAKDAAAGNITLDEKTIPRLLDIIERRSTELVDRHSTKVKALFGDTPQAQAVYGVEMPRLYVSPLKGVVDVNNEAEAAKLPPGTRVRINGRIGTVK